MVTLNDALMDLVTKKLVTPEEAYGKAIDKAGLGGCAEAGRARPVKSLPARPRRPAAPAGTRAPTGPGRAWRPFTV